MATVNSATQWLVEIYPFTNPDPEDDKTSGTGGGPLGAVSLIGTSAEALSVFPSSGSQPKSNDKNKGLRGISLRRDKSTPAGGCQLNFVGPVPQGVIPGSWIVVSSLYSQAGVNSSLIRFIGQIYEVATSYIKQPTALMSLTTSVMVREWSAALQMPVQFDRLSVFANLNGNAAAGAQILQDVTQLNIGKTLSGDDVRKLAEESFNCYEFAHVVLTLIGGMNKDQTANKIKKLDLTGYGNSSLSMPSIPKALLERLGFTDAEPDSPFTSGFLTLLSGVQGSLSGSTTEPNWNGVFKDGEFTGTYVDAFKIPNDRPVTLGIAALAMPGLVAWDLIANYCEPSVNEAFTDIFYEQSVAQDGTLQVTAIPTLVVRDKPYLLQKMKDKLTTENSDANLDNWTVYDDLPTVSINDSFITGFKMGHTFINSPNMIRVNMHSTVGARDTEEALQFAFGYERLGRQMRRWGGQQHAVESLFLGPEAYQVGDTTLPSTFDYKKWFQTLRLLSKGWNSFDYRFGNGTLIMRDGPFALSVGFNAKFKLGNFTLVGHVDAIDMTQRITETGVNETTVQAHLSRIVKLLPDGSLDFIDMDDFGRLHLADNTNGQNATDQGIDGSAGTATPSLPDLSGL